MKTKKFNKIICFIGLASMTIPAAVTLASCTTSVSYPKVFSIGNFNDVFANSKTPMGVSFVDAPTTTSFNSIYGKLLTYVNEGDYVYDEDKKQWDKTEAHIQLELAKKVEIAYTDQTTKNEKVYTIDPTQKDEPNGGNSLGGKADDDSKNPFIKKDGKRTFGIDMNVVGEYLSKATKVTFHLNDKFKWIDKNGIEKASLVPKDFYMSLKAYKNSTDLGFNSNDYFLAMAGIDYDKTIQQYETGNEKNELDKPGGKFTYIISDNTKSPYLLDILGKQYFFPMPSKHPDSAATLETKPKDPKDSKTLMFTKDKNGNVVFDASNTNWSKVYGGDQKENLDVWSVGPYYASSTSLQDVSFNINNNYFEAMKNYSDFDVSKQIPKVVMKYKAGSPEVMYNRFKSGELSYVPVPAAQNQNAINKFYGMDNSPLIPVPAPKASQGNFLAYNMSIYAIPTTENENEETNKKYELKDGIDKSWEKFIKKFHTNDGLTIRKSINELINWGRLSEIKYGQGVRDFTLSSIPYGVYSYSNNNEQVEYYEAVSQNKEFTNNDTPKTKTKLNGIIGGKYEEMKTNSNNILASGEEKNKFIAALKSIGFTNSEPLKMQFWTLSQTNDPKDIAYFKQLSDNVLDLSNGLMTFEFVPFNQNSVQNIFYNKAVTSGSFLWGPDYNGLGTWIGIYFAYAYKNDKPVKVRDNIDKTGEFKDMDILQPAYHVTNLWKPLYEELNKNGNSNGSKVDGKQTWQQSLKSHLESKKAAEFGEGKNYTNIKSNLDTEISIWAGISDSNGVNLVNWVDSHYPILPMYQPGLNYQSFKLVDPKYSVILNINGDINYRDFKIK